MTDHKGQRNLHQPEMPDGPEPAILIEGTGAMASLFAARLVSAGLQVTMRGSWLEGLDALRRNGVRWIDLEGRERQCVVDVAVRERDFPPARAALVLVKSWQTRQAARALAGSLAVDGLALSLQNGLGNREALVEELGAERVALGVTTTGATLLAPGVVRQVSPASLSLEAGSGVDKLAGWLAQAGFAVERITDPQGLLWGKLVINAAINPLTAILGVRNGELLERAGARDLLAAVVEECARVAWAKGIDLPYDDPAAVVAGVARRTGANISSMLQDVRRGAPTEIEAICGAIVQAGRETGVDTPVNRTLWQLVRALPAGAG